MRSRSRSHPTARVRVERPTSRRSSASPWKTPNNRAPNPASSAASSSVMIDIDASIVQYGAGHASVPAPRPVAALSGSEYRSTYACGSANGNRIAGASSSPCHLKPRAPRDRQRDVPETSGLIALQHEQVPTLRFAGAGARAASSTISSSRPAGSGRAENERVIRRRRTTSANSLTSGTRPVGRCAPHSSRLASRERSALAELDEVFGHRPAVDHHHVAGRSIDIAEHLDHVGVELVRLGRLEVENPD